MSGRPLQNFVNGAWKASASQRTFPVISPATRKVLAHCQDSTVGDVKEAIAAAEAAFPKWSKTLARERSAVLSKLAQLLRDNRDHFAYLMAAEMGKPITESKGEVAYAAGFFEWFAEEAKREYGDTIPPIKQDTIILTHWEPVGVVSAITPWNFPIGMIARKLGAAIAAGCTVVCKPAHNAPTSALELCRLATEAGVPAGVINMITTEVDYKDIGTVLATDPAIAKLTFTGSTKAGAELATLAAKSVKRTSLELGGNAPFIILKDADIDAAVKHGIASRFRNTGQTCVCANRFLVAKEVADEFAAKLTTAVKALKLGNPLDAETEVSALVSEAARDKVERLVKDAVAKGAKVLTGGKRPENLPSELADGFFYEPTVLDNVDESCEIASEEIFGPVVAIRRVDGEEEAIKVANDSPYGLAAYVFTRDLGSAMRVSRALETGMVAINDGLLSTEVAPFGGVKQSGHGREGSKYGLQEYSQMKYTMLAFPQ